MRRRSRIAFRLTAIYLVVALPLVAITALVYLQWYGTRVAIVEQERVGNADVIATAFELLMRDLQLTAGSVGRSQAMGRHGSPESKEELRRFQEQWPVAYVLFTGPQGQTASASDDSLLGRDLSDLSAFKEAVRSPEGTGIEPSRRHPRDVVGFHVVRRIDDSAGTTLGFLVALVDVRRLPGALDVSVPRGGVSLIDSAGTVVVHSEEPRIALQLEDWAARSPLVRKALGGETAMTSGWRLPDGDGERQIAVFVPIPRFGWVAGSSIDLQEGLAPFYRSLVITLGLTTFAALVSLIVAGLITRDIRDSLGALVEDARRIGEGDLDRPVDAGRMDEIGDVARSLDHARLELKGARRQVAEELARTTVLIETSTAAATLDSYELSQRVLDTLQRMMNVRAGAIYVVDRQRGVLRSFALRGIAEQQVENFLEFPLDGDSVSSLAVLRDEVQVIPFEDLPPESLRRANEMGWVSGFWVAVPIHLGGEPVGDITLLFPGGIEVGDEDVELFRSISDQLGISMHNAQLFERERESARLGSVVAAIDRVMHSSLKVDEVVEGALSEGAKAIEAGSAAVIGMEDGLWRVWYDWGFSPSIVGRTYTDQQNPHGVLSADTGRTLAIEDVLTDRRVDSETMRSHDLKSVVVAPLIVRGRPIAALHYNYHDAPHRFTAAEVDLVSKVASSLSLAIENSRLYESEHYVSDTLQEALLTLPDEVPDVSFAHAYQSAAEEAKVGGDFYDLFELDGGRMGITMGDIAGKGLDAAVLTSLVKNAVRAQATEPDKTPASVMSVVNTLVVRSSAPEMFATVFFGVLQRATGSLVYCNAGHTTGAVVCGHPDGTIDSLETNSPFAGAFPNIQFNESEFDLGHDDVLFLYTDGLTESRSPEGELLGEDRLFELLSAGRALPLQELVDSVVRSAIDWAGGELHDDLAVLALKRV